MFSCHRILKDDRLLICRDIIIKLLYTHDEDDLIYVYLSKEHKEVLYMNFDNNCTFLKEELLLCYKTTLKKFYLYLIAISYPNVPKENIIIFANRMIRRLSIETSAKLLKISEQEYKNIETGVTCNFNLKDISKMFNFKSEEFYYTFKNVFEMICL
ncbi:MAG: hypothetical protein KKH92_05995 [Firmicutes bacterium]|nr:hypothetical protein [Bacillota bacterium]